MLAEINLLYSPRSLSLSPSSIYLPLSMGRRQCPASRTFRPMSLQLHP